MDIVSISRVQTESEFFESCAFPPELLAKIETVGAAIHSGRSIGIARKGAICPWVSSGIDEKESSNDQRQEEGSRGPEAGQGQRQQGAQTGQGDSGPVVRQQRIVCIRQLNELRSHYPGSRHVRKTSGCWLVVPVQPLGAEGPRAKIYIAIPSDPNRRILAWAFWVSSEAVAWVGPRHTNFPDGSVCAFPADGEYWQSGDSIKLLVHLYTEWLFRHIHLHFREFWPGPQEGLVGGTREEQRHYRYSQGLESELCFCGSGRNYFDCCRPFDEKDWRPTDAENFRRRHNGLDVGQQQPHPILVRKVANGSRKLPELEKVHPDYPLFSLRK